MKIAAEDIGAGSDFSRSNGASRRTPLCFGPILVVCALAVACTGQPGAGSVAGLTQPSDSVIDLTNRLRFESPEWEVSVLDVGGPRARGRLLDGWSYDEGADTGRTGAWGQGLQSDVTFFVSRPHDLVLKLGCWSLSAPDVGPQVMTVLVNGHDVGRLEVGPNRGGSYRLALPTAVLRTGINQLTFRFAWALRPIDVIPGSSDQRPLAVMFDEIAFEGLVDAEEPELLEDRQTQGILLPARSSVGFHFDAPDEAELWIGAIVGRQVHGCSLDLGVFNESGLISNRQVDVGGGILTPLKFELPVEPGERVEVRFTVRASDVEKICRGAVEVWEPHVTGARGTAVETLGGRESINPPWSDWPRKPNILIYLIDCLRADHLGTYGYPRPVSPSIDRLAEDAVVFDNEVASASWTRPAVASLLTGLPPKVHGSQAVEDALSGNLPVLQELLQAAGYQTAAVVTNGVVSAKFGFDRGFDDFRFLPEQHKENPEIHQLSDRVNVELFDLLSSRDASKPFFVYVHSTDPHAPYLPRSPFKERFAAGVDSGLGLHPAVEDLTQGRKASTSEIRRALVDLYDAEIAFNDEQFGRLVEWLKAHDLYDDTVIVVTADHGEEFDDHGRWQHGFTLYQEMLRVPLVIKLPGSTGGGGRRTETVSQIDIAPTLLESVGIDVPSSMLGRSLRPWIAEEITGLAERPVFADLHRDPQWRSLEAVLVGSDKLILNRAYDLPRPMWELYDVAGDPGETVNRSARDPVDAGFLAALLREAGAIKATAAPTTELSAADEEKLRALGYIQ